MTGRLARMVLLSGLVPIVVACGSTTSNSTSSGVTASPAATPSTCPTGAPPGTGSAITIQATDFCFSPNTLNLVVGKKVTITFVNKGAVEHDLTIGAIDVGEADAGQTKTFTFTPAASAQFFCKYHKESHNMVGTMSATSASGGGGTLPSSAPAPHYSSNSGY